MITPEQKLADVTRQKAFLSEMRILLAHHGIKGTLEAIATIAEEYTKVPDDSAGYWMRVQDAVDECVSKIADMEIE